jgi:hypothetical protein
MGSTKMCLGSPFNRDPKSIMGSIKMCPFWVLLHGQHQNLSILSPVKWAASKCVHFGSFYMGSIKMCPFWILLNGQHQKICVSSPFNRTWILLWAASKCVHYWSLLMGSTKMCLGISRHILDGQMGSQGKK